MTDQLSLRDAAVAYMGERPSNERPAHRLIQLGPAALTDAELIACLFGNNTAAIVDAAHLLDKFKDLAGITKASLADMATAQHVGPARFAMLRAAFELGRRLYVASPDDRPIITAPETIAHMLMAEMGLLDQEHLRVAMLDGRNRLIGIHALYIGAVDRIAVRVGEVFRQPIRDNASTIILVHNHPSGDPSPSPNDVEITRMVREAGELLKIELLDHIIIGRQRFCSLKTRGLGFN